MIEELWAYSPKKEDAVDHLPTNTMAFWTVERIGKGNYGVVFGFITGEPKDGKYPFKSEYSGQTYWLPIKVLGKWNLSPVCETRAEKRVIVYD